MEKHNYIHLFYKFLQKRTSVKEVSLLLKWWKSTDCEEWLQQEWNVASEAINPIVKDRILRNIYSCISIGQRKKQFNFSIRYVILKIACSILLLFLGGIGIFYLSQLDNSSLTEAIISVEKGQKAKIQLPDGTNVWINSDSKLSYNTAFNSKDRIVKLEGEAYFEVSKNLEKPFVVHIPDMSIKVLGTSFNIKSYTTDDEFITTLVAGKVEIETNHKKTILYPNQKAVYNRNNQKITVLDEMDAVECSCWRNNILRFNSETFENVAETLERYYNVTIVLESEKVKRFRMTGPLVNSSLESTLEVLSLTFPIIYTIDNEIITIKEKK